MTYFAVDWRSHLSKIPANQYKVLKLRSRETAVFLQSNT